MFIILTLLIFCSCLKDVKIEKSKCKEYLTLEEFFKKTFNEYINSKRANLNCIEIEAKLKYIMSKYDIKKINRYNLNRDVWGEIYKFLPLDTKIDLSYINNNLELSNGTLSMVRYETWLDIVNFDVDSIKALLELGMDINHTNSKGENFLHIACREANIEITKYLIENGINIDKTEHQHSHTPLMICLKNFHKPNSEEILNFLLDSGCSVDIEDMYNNVDFCIAAEKGYEKALKILNRVKINENYVNKTLMLATKNGYLESVKLTIDAGANVYFKDYEGRTALIWASKRGHKEIIEFLIDLFSSDEKDHYGLSALDYAKFKCYDEIVDLLEDKFQYNDIEIKELSLDEKMKIMRHFTAGEEEKDINYLIQRVKNVNSTIGELFENNSYYYDFDYENDRLLDLAARQGDLKIVKLLLKRGANLNNRNSYNQTALMQAANSGNFKIVEKLLKKGADINLLDKSEENALFYALDGYNDYLYETLGNIEFQEEFDKQKARDYLKIINMLLSKGINVNQTNIYGDTILIMIFSSEHFPGKESMEEIAKFLIKSGANLSYKNKKGHTILTFAAGNLWFDMTKFLLRKGESFQKLDDKGKETLKLASVRGKKEDIEFLTNLGAEADFTAMALEALRSNNIEILNLLIDRGFDAKYIDEYQNNLLIIYFLSLNNCKTIDQTIKILELLLEKGIDINHVNIYGNSIIHQLLKCHFLLETELLEFLINKGANTNIANFEGETPLLIASREGYTKLVEVLLNRGALINYISNPLTSFNEKINLWHPSNTTALILASGYGMLEVVKLLIKRGANLNIVDKDGNSALLAALVRYTRASNGCSGKSSFEYIFYKICKLLVKNGADINIVNKNGDNAYSLAKKKDKKILEFLENY